MTPADGQSAERDEAARVEVIAPPDSEIIQSFFAGLGGNNSVVLAGEIQSFQSVKPAKTTEKPKPPKDEDDDDDWRFEIKRKRRKARRKNAKSTAKDEWYYWVIRIRLSDGEIEYYGTLDVLDEMHPERLRKYWKRSKARKVGKNA